MKTPLTIAFLALLSLLPGCKYLPASLATDSHTFQCHAVSPGPCAYVVFNESGSVRETFTLAPGQSRLITNTQARTAFCLAVEKPLEPAKCQRLGLDGKPLQK